jgi:hypothetical protein
MVDERWPAIERVAEALTRRDILNQDELDALIAQQSRPIASPRRRARPSGQRGIIHRQKR